MKNALLRLSVAASLAIGSVMATALPAAADPNPKPTLPKELDNKLNTLLGLVLALGTFACVAGFIFCAIKMALAFRRGEGGEAAGQLGFVAGACVLLGSATTLTLFLM